MGAKEILNLGLCGALVGGIAAVLAAGPAQAQFYSVDRVYRCLEKPGADCAKAEENLPPLPPERPPAPPLAQAIARIVAMKATAADVAEIEQQAAEKEPRAIEALAWCRLHGIGGMADPVEAFRLYGEAARFGIPFARSNQIAIYETRLSPEQRQLVLMREQTP